MIEKLFRGIITYSLAMMIAGLVIGVLYREFTKIYTAGLPLEKQLLVSYYLSLGHGHVFMVGVLIPLALLVSTYVLTERGYLDRDRLNSLEKPFIIFVAGSLMMVGLLVYKGLGMVYFYAQNPGAGLSAADEKLFLGSKALRESLYGVAHLAMGVGLVWYVWMLIRYSRKASEKP